MTDHRMIGFAPLKPTLPPAEQPKTAASRMRSIVIRRRQAEDPPASTTQIPTPAEPPPVPTAEDTISLESDTVLLLPPEEIVANPPNPSTACRTVNAILEERRKKGGAASTRTTALAPEPRKPRKYKVQLTVDQMAAVQRALLVHYGMICDHTTSDYDPVRMDLLAEAGKSIYTVYRLVSSASSP